MSRQMSVTLEVDVKYTEMHTVIVELPDVNIKELNAVDTETLAKNDKELANKLAKEMYLEGKSTMESQNLLDTQDFEKGICGYYDHNYL